MEKTRILVVDDHPIVGEGLAMFLNPDPGLQVIASAGNALAGLEKLRKLNPEIVVLDLAMPEMSGQEAIKLYCEVNPRLGIVVFSSHQEEKHLIQALQAGARGYVVKGSSIKELKQAIEAVCKGEYWVSPLFRSGIIAGFLKSRRGETAGLSAFGTLSEREQQVFRLMVAGKETEDIAAILCISGNTVAKHRTSLLRKLGLKNVVEMTKFAIRNGLIDA